MPFWLSHQSIRHSKLCTIPINQSITSQLKISLPTNQYTTVMSRRESRFFEEMNCGVRRLYL